MIQKKWPMVAMAFALCFVSGGVIGQSCTGGTCPAVQVLRSAQPVGGGPPILCYGDACADVLESLEQQLGGGTGWDMELAPEGPEIDRLQLCSNLSTKRPAGCNLSNPPPSPGIGTNWVPNGCGTGPLANAILDVALGIAASHSYSGNLNAPYPGVSFLSACNGHDQCYAEARGRSECDFQFNQRMEGACNSAGLAGNNYMTCLAYAHGYHGAVGFTNAGSAAYAASAAARACSLWALDMRTNGCT